MAQVFVFTRVLQAQLSGVPSDAVESCPCGLRGAPEQNPHLSLTHHPRTPGWSAGANAEPWRQDTVIHSTDTPSRLRSRSEVPQVSNKDPHSHGTRLPVRGQDGAGSGHMVAEFKPGGPGGPH